MLSASSLVSCQGIRRRGRGFARTAACAPEPPCAHLHVAVGPKHPQHALLTLQPYSGTFCDHLPQSLFACRVNPKPHSLAFKTSHGPAPAGLSRTVGADTLWPRSLLPVLTVAVLFDAECEMLSHTCSYIWELALEPPETGTPLSLFSDNNSCWRLPLSLRSGVTWPYNLFGSQAGLGSREEIFTCALTASFVSITDTKPEAVVNHSSSESKKCVTEQVVAPVHSTLPASAARRVSALQFVWMLCFPHCLTSEPLRTHSSKQ